MSAQVKANILSLIYKKTLKIILLNEQYKRVIQAIIKLDESWGQGVQIINLIHHFCHIDYTFIELQIF